MSYATQQDLIDRYGEAEMKDVADRDGDDAIDAEVVAGAIADAETLIDGYVGSRYALPLAAAPALLTQLACEIARYKLHKDSPPEVVAKNYDAALRSLRDIADGRMALPVGEAETPTPAGDGVRISRPDRVFSSDTLKGF